MARQLTLIENPPSWRLDDATREAGRRGVADARASLQAALSGGTQPAPRAKSRKARKPGGARRGTSGARSRSAA